MKEREALKLAIDRLEWFVDAYPHDITVSKEEFLRPFKEALAQPAVAEQHKQEPVAIQYASSAERDLYEMEDEDDTTPPQRTWVGLTYEDKKEYAMQDFGGNRLDAMDWADKRLKEKNS